MLCSGGCSIEGCALVIYFLARRDGAGGSGFGICYL